MARKVDRVQDVEVFLLLRWIYVGQISVASKQREFVGQMRQIREEKASDRGSANHAFCVEVITAYEPEALAPSKRTSIRRVFSLRELQVHLGRTKMVSGVC